MSRDGLGEPRAAAGGAPLRALASAVRPRALPGPGVTAAILLAAALATWIITVARMRGMDGGPGTDLGGLAWFVPIWVTMMAAMMLPAAAPMVLTFSRVSADRVRRGRGDPVPTWIFLSGYLLAWTAYGLAAFGLYTAISAVDAGFLEWDARGPAVAGGAIIAAGIYQLTPLKRVCLRHCRTPLHFVLHGWREGRLGALRMGLEHGAWCVGCCWGLMVILFALGVMSLLWMAVVAAVIFAEKVLPIGPRLPAVFAACFIALGIWIAAAPSSVPGLTEPGTHMGGMPGMEQAAPAGMEEMERGAPAGMDGPEAMRP